MRHRVRSASLTGFPELAGSLGLDPGRSMSRVGLDLADLADPDRWIPAAPVARLLDLSARQSGCEDFGLRLSEYRRFSTLGPLSLVLAQEPDLRSAVDLLIRYEDAYTGVLDLRLVESDELATLQVWLDFGEPVPLRQALEYTASACVGIIRELLGAPWQPSSACFSHDAPADRGMHRRIFRGTLQFGAGFTGLVFAAGDLGRPITSSDPALRRYTRRFLESVASDRPATFTGEVSELVGVLLPTGRTGTGELARMLGMTPRTLHRRLAAEGATFSSVLHTVRARLAVRHLGTQRYTLTDVSELLGFAAPSAFSRWFRQQFGVSPSQWRRAAQGERPPSPSGSSPSGSSPSSEQSPAGGRGHQVAAPGGGELAREATHAGADGVRRDGHGAGDLGGRAPGGELP